MKVTRTHLVNGGILALTVILVSLIVTLGRDTGGEVPVELAVGQPSPQTFIADRSTAPIDDLDATELEREQKRAAVETQYTRDNEAELAVKRDVNTFFADLRQTAIDEEALAEQEEFYATSTTTTTVAETTTSSLAEGETTTSTSTTTTTTQPTTTTTTTLPRRTIEDQEARLIAAFPGLKEAVPGFVALYNNDLDRIADGEAETFSEVEAETNEIIDEELARGIKPTEIGARQDLYLSPLTRPAIFVVGLPSEDQRLARESIAELVGRTLQANLKIDDEATNAARDAAAASVQTVTTIFRAGDTIIEAGDAMGPIEFEAIDQLDLYRPEVVGGTSQVAIALLAMLAVLLAAFFLWRIAPAQWGEPRHIAILGILLVLSAVISRLPEIVSGDDRALGYLLPAVSIGFLAAILFDPRTAVVLAVPMAGFTAISTGDLAYTVYAGIATVVPVAFVSRVSSRRQLRLAVLLAAATAAPFAVAVEWVFGDGSLLMSLVWAFTGSVIAGLISLGLVSFLETAFGVTTTLGLLDLLDRNHPALRLIEEQAPGTFNHSMLVGALAGRAARAIDADPLLAQAAAWYHDLGKTQLPQYFVENQFGVSNPHDTLPPTESAQIIRSHVTEGLRLAKRYRIPRDVADGIRMHHGTSLMRYFYHRALEADPDADPEPFRHTGVKPVQKEMAIVMISDATEAAARAYSHEEDPTAVGLKNVVETVVQEKVDDGQLDESQLTFGDLTRVKAELVRALMGYYHARVPYPGFPGPRVGDGAGRPAALPHDVDGTQPELVTAEVASPDEGDG